LGGFDPIFKYLNLFVQALTRSGIPLPGKTLSPSDNLLVNHYFSMFPHKFNLFILLKFLNYLLGTIKGHGTCVEKY